ncbi:ABC transporter substrate-binding protein [Thermodesulfobacteriota bacterium]
MDRVEIADKNTVIVYNKEPFPSILDCVDQLMGIVPKAYVEKVGDEGFAKNAIGAGPFRAIKYKQDASFEAEAVEEHYRKVPNIKRVRYLNVQENATRMAMMKASEVDLCKLDYGTFWELKDDPNIRIEYIRNTYCVTLAFYDLLFPKEKSPFLDVRVRKATSLAIDRKGICEGVLHGLNEPTANYIAPYTIGYDPSIKPDPYDPEKAKALLKEAGYPNGFETTICSSPIAKYEMQAIAAMLTKVGIRTKVLQYESGTYRARVTKKTARGLGRHPGPWWVGKTHPASALDHFKSTATWCFYTTPEVDKLMEELEALTDEKEITAKARKVTKLYSENYIRAPLWAQSVPYGMGPRIKYWKQTPGWVFAVNFEFLELNE